jgi:hypothetical protein
MTNTLAYFCLRMSGKEKKFYIIDTRPTQPLGNRIVRHNRDISHKTFLNVIYHFTIKHYGFVIYGKLTNFIIS